MDRMDAIRDAAKAHVARVATEGADLHGALDDIERPYALVVGRAHLRARGVL